MALDEAGEGQLGTITIAVGESLEELSIRQIADRPRREQCANRSDRRPVWTAGHGVYLRVPMSCLYQLD